MTAERFAIARKEEGQFGPAAARKDLGQWPTWLTKPEKIGAFTVD
jgi:hypothetical protein